MMAEQSKPCPGCGAEPFVSQCGDPPRRLIECKNCSFAADESDWQTRTPGPATKAMLVWAKQYLRFYTTSSAPWPSETDQRVNAFIAEWPKPATPTCTVDPTPEEADETSQAVEHLAEAIEDVIPEWPNYIEAERKEGWRVYTRIGSTLLCSDFLAEPSEAVCDLEERASQFLAGKVRKPFKPATPPSPDVAPLKSSPWTCCVCGEPVRIGDDLRPWHIHGPANHEAELSDEDRKTLADGLRLTD